MKVYNYFLAFTLLCLLPSDTVGERKLRIKRDAHPLPQLLRNTVPSGVKIFKKMKFVWSDIGNGGTEKNIMGQFVSITTDLGELDTEMKISESAINTLLRAYPKVPKLELALNDLTQIINQINFAEEQMRAYLAEGNKTSSGNDNENPFVDFRRLKLHNKTHDYAPLEQMSSHLSNRGRFAKRIMERFTLVDFATWATGHSYNSPISLLRRMHDLVVRGERNGLFEKVYDVSTETTSNVCALRHSPYQTMYNLYISIAVAELKGNAVLHLAYALLKMYKLGQFTGESSLALETYTRNTKEKIHALINVLPASDRSIYNCDAPKQVDGVTYTYLTKLQQAYIENEVNLNRGHNCWDGCRITRTKYYGCYGNKFCSKQPQCAGAIVNCHAASDDMRICRSKKKDRRYDWIKYQNGGVYGRTDTCDEDNYFKVRSWWRYLFWKCSYCVCTCDDHSHESDRYFNLRNVTSDRGNNKIVTGVRIVKQNQVIHLQIQEGVLGPVGLINMTTLSWKPVENYTVLDKTFTNNKDYFTMNHESRAIDTNELTALPGYVVTGVRFRNRENHVDLDVHVTPFNFTSGKLQLTPSDHSYWISSNETHPKTGAWRTRISLLNPDVPIFEGPHSLHSRKNQYLLFEASDYEKDAGQSTVPYFDSQPLTSEGFAISGFGLIHRGKTGSGGFIAPKLMTYDFAAHLEI